MTLRTTFKGFWWFPGKSERKMSGDLTLYEDGLVTLSALWDESPSSAVEHDEENGRIIPIIHGHARNTENNEERQFTLFENRISKSSVSSLAIFKIVSRYAVEHFHFKTQKSLMINSAFIKLSLFHEWLNITGIKTPKRNFKKGHGLTFKYSLPKAVTLLKNKQLHLSIQFFYETMEPARRKFELLEEPILFIEFTEKVTFNEFNKYHEIIRNFFSFCICLPLASEEIIIHRFSSEELKELQMGHQLGMPMHIGKTAEIDPHLPEESDPLLPLQIDPPLPEQIDPLGLCLN